MKNTLFASFEGFNRTFMELKLNTTYRSTIITTGFNRTFMELKLHVILLCLKHKAVLIVPLWNWNFLYVFY